jgi:MoxR-like ATPase
MERIIAVHQPSLKKDLLAAALARFSALRETPGLKKRPSTSELLDWIKLLVAEDIPASALREEPERAGLPPLYGALLKNEQDVHLVEQLMFINRRVR